MPVTRSSDVATLGAGWRVIAVLLVVGAYAVPLVREPRAKFDATAVAS